VFNYHPDSTLVTARWLDYGENEALAAFLCCNVNDKLY
jgi:hypothetical protein